jgi:glycosyltransferase involved in cell wall biosynthesis
MRILICTQAMDKNDPVLGFFHRWVEEFSNRAERIHVICLKEGEHSLPENVTVYSLGKENMGGPRFIKRLRYIARIKLLVWKLRKEYDSVFVHMNQEYILAAGLIWRMLGKRIVLWRNHKMGSALTRIAGLLSHVVCYTSPFAYVASYKNSIRMPIGIDTNMFKPVSHEPRSILFLGRLDPVKMPNLFLDALKHLESVGVKFRANMYGEPTDKKMSYDSKVTPLIKSGVLAMHPSVRNDETPQIYAAHDVYVNLTPSGSFDKTIGEAMAAGCVVVAANDAVSDVLPEMLIADSESPSSVSKKIQYALSLSQNERAELVEKSRAFVEREHSLALLSKKLFKILAV